MNGEEGAGGKPADRAGQSSPGHLTVSAEEVRAFGYRMVDILVERLADAGERPIHPPLPPVQDFDAAFGGGVPGQGTDPMLLLEHLDRQLVPASANFLHPGIMAWVAATPLPLPGLLGGLLGALRIFPHAWKLTPGSIQMELTVGRWLGEMTGFSDSAFGYVTTGGTMANLYGLAAARCERAGWDVRGRGVRGGPALVVYASEEAHICIEQGVSLLGIGTAGLRRVPVDGDSRMRCDLLETMVERDLRAGLRPFCVVATAGTTLTGAVDPLGAVADKQPRSLDLLMENGASVLSDIAVCCTLDQREAGYAVGHIVTMSSPGLAGMRDAGCGMPMRRRTSCSRPTGPSNGSPASSGPPRAGDAMPIASCSRTTIIPNP